MFLSPCTNLYSYSGKYGKDTDDLSSKYGLVGSSSLPFQGLMCTQTLCTKIAPQPRIINVLDVDTMILCLNQT